jgi:hypothetical protein
MALQFDHTGASDGEDTAAAAWSCDVLANRFPNRGRSHQIAAKIIPFSGNETQPAKLDFSYRESDASYDQASNAIGHFLRGRRNEAALKAHLQQLQSAAKIQYVGDGRPTASPGP